MPGSTRFAFAALAVAALLACTAEPPPAPARWQVTRGFLRDPEGRAVVMRGVNLSSEHKQAPYLGWHTQADFQRLREEWGFGAVRFLLSWAAVEPSRGSYDDRYLDDVARRLEWAKQAGLLVVLDMHQDLFGEGFGGDGAPRWACDESKYAAHHPTSPWFLNYLSPPLMECFDRLWTDPALGKSYAEAWRHVATRLGEQAAVIGLDIINEPYPGTIDPQRFETERLASFYRQVIEAVRGAAPGWIAFVEPSVTRNLGVPTALRDLGVPDVVYAPHSYDGQAEAGQGFTPSRREALIANLEALAVEARGLDAALWIGEYGGNAEHPGIADYMDAQYDGAAAKGAGSMYWDYSRGPGYGLLQTDGSEKQALLDVLVRPYPERVAGDEVSFTFDETTRELTVLYRADPTVSAATEIVLPARVYPSGYQVTCRNCRFEKARARLLVTAPPEGTPARIIVRP